MNIASDMIQAGRDFGDQPSIGLADFGNRISGSHVMQAKTFQATIRTAGP